MRIANKFLAQMRAATRSMMRRGPSVARSVIRESVKNATAMQAGAVKSAQQAAQQAAQEAAQTASNQESYDPVPDMLADLGRQGQSGANPFHMPPLSSGAAAAGLPGQFISASFSNEAGTRDYKLYVPGSYVGQAGPSKAAPLLVMLHGCTQNPDDFAAGTQMNQLAEEMEWLVVYPEQTANANHSKCWNWFNAIDQQRGQGEPSIIAGIAQQIIDEYPVNERQVYVAGLSAGGAMAVIVGTLYPELFAAVGVHSGLPYASAQDLPSALTAMKRDFRTHHAPGKALPCPDRRAAPPAL
jgi:poly(hydroxyalkanoate) depolymerase family esterase